MSDEVSPEEILKRCAAAMKQAEGMPDFIYKRIAIEVKHLAHNSYEELLFLFAATCLAKDMVAYGGMPPPNPNELIEIGANQQIKYQAIENAKKRLANDPKQAEKKFVRECWNEWQKSPEQYKNNTKFATAMIDKFRPENPEEEGKHLSSVKVITEWCADWATTK